jgi:hypothetical protein
MKATEELIESFRSFALERLGRKDGDLSIDELYDCWRRENPTRSRPARTLLAVQASLRDMQRGERGRPFDGFAREFRTRRHIPDAE